MASPEPAWIFLLISFRFTGNDVSPMLGLYDRDGMLRFVGSSLEACVEYAALFKIQLSPSSLQDLPEPAQPGVIIRGRRHLEGHSS